MVCLSLFALVFGTKLCASTIFIMVSFAAGETSCLLFKTRDTVVTEYPDSFAISTIVIVFPVRTAIRPFTLYPCDIISFTRYIIYPQLQNLLI